MSESAARTGSSFIRALRLLVPASPSDPPGARSIELLRHRWVVVERPPAEGGTEYTCVSYSWGGGRTASPFDEGQIISDRALPAVEATIRARQPAAIWIDAVGVPAHGPDRVACLRRLGAIYSGAVEVVAVLSKACAALLEEIQRTGRVGAETLLTLEADDWVTRAWTYQEIVNSRNIHFVVERDAGASVTGAQLLNSVGQAIDDFRRAVGVDAFKFRALHPRLDSLEDVIADWRISDSLERSAYQVMAEMDRRVSQRDDDRFYAMIGAISVTPADEAEAVDPAETFMRACEAKGDYSFIYSTAPRSQAPGKCWRPAAGPIPALLPWLTFGSGQSGSVHATHLELNGMCRMVRGSRRPSATEFLVQWLRSDRNLSEFEPMPLLILARLRQIGFSGSGDHMELESGYFFPQAPLAHTDDDTVVVVTREVTWRHGAPGLLLVEKRGAHHCCGVGVFVGPPPATGESIQVGGAGKALATWTA